MAVSIVSCDFGGTELDIFDTQGTLQERKVRIKLLLLQYIAPGLHM